MQSREACLNIVLTQCNMILGISSFTYGWAFHVRDGAAPLTAKDLVAQTLAFGLKCLQIGDNLPLHAMPPDQLSGLRDTVQKNNIRLEIGARGLTDENLQRYLELATNLRSPLLRFVIDEAGYQPDTETIISMLKNTLADLRRHQIILGIENHDRFKARELVYMMEAISDDRVGICLDSVNSIGAGEGIEWVTDLLAPFTVNLHIKDFTVRRFPHNMGFTVAGAPSGQGMLDLPMVMEKLSKYNRCHSAILEQWVIPEERIADTIKKEKRWAVEGINYLKQLAYFRTNIL